MKYIKSFDLFEDLNPNTPQGYLKSLTKKPNLSYNNKNKEQKPTDDVDSLLQDTENQKQNIIAKKDAIEKGLLSNIRDMEPDNQKEVQTQIKDYDKQVKEFDKTVKQVDKLNQTLKQSDRPIKQNDAIKKAREQNKL